MSKKHENYRFRKRADLHNFNESSSESDSDNENLPPKSPKQSRRQGPDSRETPRQENYPDVNKPTSEESGQDAPIGESESDHDKSSPDQEMDQNELEPATQHDDTLEDQELEQNVLDPATHRAEDTVNTSDESGGSTHSGESDFDSASDTDAEEVDSEDGDDGNNVRQGGNGGGGGGNGGDNPLLYPGAPIGVFESVLAIMTFAFAHCLTGACITDLLQLISLHCPVGSLCVRTLYKLKKFFKKIGRELLILHYFCPACFVLLNGKEEVCDKCGPQTEKCFFLEIPILHQLQDLFLRPGFYEDLQYRFTRTKKHADNIEDIYDGNIYKAYTEHGFLSKPENLSFMWYTDGVKVFKSSKFSIWPLYLVITELSYKKRVQRKNIVLAGLWFGPTKPNVNSFLSPFHSELNKFKEDGYLLRLPNQQYVRVRGALLCGTCDLPAKSSFMRLKQFNGSFSCAKCMQKGERYQLGEKSSIQVFPYTPNVTLRNNDDIERYSRVAVAAGAPCFGVKGPSLLYHMLYDMVRSTAIDPMHGIFSGLAKLLLELLFDSTYSRMPFSIRGMVATVNARMKSLKPPSFLHRLSQAVDDLANWKSLDFKTWFFYYSLPTLFGVMNHEYFSHHVKVVKAVFLLSRNSISINDINNARRLLNDYVRDFQRLYGLRHLGMNVHQLLHLPDVVLDLGPLWVYSCFFLEDLNGNLVKLVHGTRHAGLQICSSTSIFLKLSSCVSELPADSTVKIFCQKMDSIKKQYKVVELISPGLEAVGVFSSFCVPRNIQEAVLLHVNIRGGRYQSFQRLMKNGVMFFSEEYERVKMFDSTFVSFLKNNTKCLGKINHFLRWSNCNCRKKCLCQPASHLCYIQLYEKIPMDVDMPSYLAKVNCANDYVVVHVTSLLNLCFYVEVKETVEGAEIVHTYIMEPVNNLEKE